MTNPPPELSPPRFDSAPAALAWYAQHRPDATAVVETGQSVSYAALAAEVAKRARELASRGAGPHRIIGLEIRPERYLSLVLLLACEALQATAAPLAVTDLRADDPVTRRCDFLLLRSQTPTPDLPPAYVVEDLPPGASAGRAPSDDDLLLLSRPVDPDLIARISRTSGTTGRPKLIPTSFGVQRRTIAGKFAYSPDPIRRRLVFLCIYNIGIRHIHHRMLAVLEAGGTVLLAKEQEVPALLTAGFVNHIHLMAGDAERVALAMAPSAHVANTLVGLSGSRASPDLRRLVRERLGEHIEVAYASNETNRIAMVGDDDVGTLVTGASVRIVDDTGAEVPTGRIGVIQARTRTMVDGYFDDPTGTEAAFINGWYHTRDAGYVPEPGKLVVLGRADDMLNIGGIKIAPHPIEDALRAIDGITDAALIAMPGAVGTARLLVAVEFAGASLPGHVAATVHAIVTPHQRHYRLCPLPSFPRTETGKVRRADIAAAFGNHDDT